MERGKSPKSPDSGIARNRAAKNGRTCPLLFHLLINKNSTGMDIIASSLRFVPHFATNLLNISQILTSFQILTATIFKRKVIEIYYFRFVENTPNPKDATPY